MSSADDIARLNTQMAELKDYLSKIEKRIDTIYSDMGHVRENIATRDDLNRLREIVATSKDVDRLWKFGWICLGALLALLGSLVYYFLTR